MLTTSSAARVALQIILGGVPLTDQDVTFTTIPGAGPVFIRPADVERQVKIRIIGGLLRWQPEQTSSKKPIELEAERPGFASATWRR
jgi:hypothetical protein